MRALPTERPRVKLMRYCNFAGVQLVVKTYSLRERCLARGRGDWRDATGTPSPCLIPEWGSGDSEVWGLRGPGWERRDPDQDSAGRGRAAREPGPGGLRSAGPVLVPASALREVSLGPHRGPADAGRRACAREARPRLRPPQPPLLAAAAPLGTRSRAAPRGGRREGGAALPASRGQRCSQPRRLTSSSSSSSAPSRPPAAQLATR